MTGNNLTNTNPNTTHTIEEFIEAGSVSSSVTYYYPNQVYPLYP